MSTGEDPNELPVKQEDLPEGVILREHVVDGIQEYDQRLPFWWLCILFGMIIFSIIYWLVLDDRSFEGAEDQRLEAKLNEVATKRLASSIDVTNDDLFWEMASNPAFVSAGQATYETNCVACHGKELQGGIGFNLVDAEWVHGSKPSEIYVTVSEGVLEKGMQAWEPLLGQKRVAEVVAFLLSKNDRATLESAQPVAPKAPESDSDASATVEETNITADGKAIVKKNCIVCHGPELKGIANLGSDLTDDVWLQGGTKEALINTVTNGILEKGMVPWKGTLTDSEIEAAVDYIISQNPSLN